MRALKLSAVALSLVLIAAAAPGADAAISAAHHGNVDAASGGRRAPKPRLPPRAHELHAGNTYDEYLAAWGKPAPASAAERAEREALFAAELAAVLAHNADGAQTYKRGLNQFSDMRAAEKATRLMAHARDEFVRSAPPTDAPATATVTAVPVPPATSAAPGPAPRPLRRTVDYRKADPPVLTAVKDQGACGSCWSFSTTETVESHYALRTGKLFDLSMQQMVSCVPHFNASFKKTPDGPTKATQDMYGCNGYMPHKALDYVAASQNGSFTQEWEVPYQSYWDQWPNEQPEYKPTPVCMNDKQRTRTVAKGIDGFVMNPPNDQAVVEDSLFLQGPLITLIYVVDSFFSYESGIYSDPQCTRSGPMPMIPSHAVQIVGYGHDAALNASYWIVRNSWSPAWGEDGYVRMLRHDTPVCGRMMLPLTDSDDVFVPQKACGMCGLLSYTVYPSFNDATETSVKK